MTQDLYELINTNIKEKISYLESLIEDLRASNNETKSSMGDKYETSREMMQQEITRIQNQLNEVLIQQELFLKITPLTTERIVNGSYVETSMGNFCIACSLGEINYNGKRVFVLSNATPLAKGILGKQIGDSFEMNGKKFTINCIH